MPDCDHCGDGFDDEGAYLEHLAAEHEGELSAIEKRRVEQHTGDDDGGVSTGLVVLVVSLVGAVALVGFFLFDGGGTPGAINQTTAGDPPVVALDGTAPDGIETEPLQSSGRDDVISQVREESFQGGRNVGSHVGSSTLGYDSDDPPTLGPHTSGVVEAGFYDETRSFGPILHSLEHGAVVIYYDPEAISDDARESLQAFASQHTGTWRSVIVMPHPGETDTAYELTAWGHRVGMNEYDARVVQAFASEYIGRGPENPVR